LVELDEVTPSEQRILDALKDGPLRFTEIKKKAEFENNDKLTHDLRSLQIKGRIGHTLYRGPPIRSVYHLAPQGEKAEVEKKGLAHDELAADPRSKPEDYTSGKPRYLELTKKLSEMRYYHAKIMNMMPSILNMDYSVKFELIPLQAAYAALDKDEKIEDQDYGSAIEHLQKAASKKKEILDIIFDRLETSIDERKVAHLNEAITHMETFINRISSKYSLKVPSLEEERKRLKSIEE